MVPHFFAGTAIVLATASFALGLTPNEYGDCLVQWGGSIRGYWTACEDGAPCDLDGVADGACALDLTPCLDSPVNLVCADGPEAGAAVTPHDVPAAVVLQSALDALIAENTSAPRCRNAVVRVPVARRRGRNRAVALNVVAETSVPYYRSEQDLALYCIPAGAGPSFSAEIAPMLSARCGVAGCHTAADRAGGIDFSSRDTGYQGLLQSSKVRPDRPRRSSLRFTLRYRMPPGCPGGPSPVPPGGCLTRDERRRILAWVLAGGPDN